MSSRKIFLEYRFSARQISWSKCLTVLCLRQKLCPDSSQSLLNNAGQSLAVKKNVNFLYASEFCLNFCQYILFFTQGVRYDTFIHAYIHVSVSSSFLSPFSLHLWLTPFQSDVVPPLPWLLQVNQSLPCLCLWHRFISVNLTAALEFFGTTFD